MGWRAWVRRVRTGAGAAEHAVVGLHEVDLWTESAGHFGCGCWAYGADSRDGGSQVVWDHRRLWDDSADRPHDDGSWIDNDGTCNYYFFSSRRYADKMGTVWRFVVCPLFSQEYLS